MAIERLIAMNYLELYVDIFNTTTKWDRRERELRIYEWSQCLKPEYPTFTELLKAIDELDFVHYGEEFNDALLFPFLDEEIKSSNLEAVRLLYDCNLDKQFVKFKKYDRPLFTIGLSIDPEDTQMMYEEFLYLTQMLESSLRNTHIGIYYKDHLATKSEMIELDKLKDIYIDLCDKLRKNNIRTSQLLHKISSEYPVYCRSL